TADDQRRRRVDAALGSERREHDVDTLEAPELADEDKVDGIVRHRRLVELMRIEPIRDDHDRAGRLADNLAVAPRGEQALENDAVTQRREPALGLDIEAAAQRRRRIMQTSAVRVVEGVALLALLRLEPPRREPRIGAAFGAVAMHHID